MVIRRRQKCYVARAGRLPRDPPELQSRDGNRGTALDIEFKHTRLFRSRRLSNRDAPRRETEPKVTVKQVTGTSRMKERLEERTRKSPFRIPVPQNSPGILEVVKIGLADVKCQRPRNAGREQGSDTVPLLGSSRPSCDENVPISKIFKSTVPCWHCPAWS